VRGNQTKRKRTCPVITDRGKNENLERVDTEWGVKMPEGRNGSANGLRPDLGDLNTLSKRISVGKIKGEGRGFPDEEGVGLAPTSRTARCKN